MNHEHSDLLNRRWRRAATLFAGIFLSVKNERITTPSTDTTEGSKATQEQYQLMENLRHAALQYQKKSSVFISFHNGLIFNGMEATLHVITTLV